MNFTEIVNEVVDITKRPDKQAEIASAINKAILFYSLKGDFPQDISEITLPIDATLYGDTIPMSNFPNFRKFSYVKRYGQLGYLSPIGPDKILTPTNSTQKDVYFIAGTNLTYILKDLAPSLEVGYFQLPALLSGTDTNWLLTEIPWVIIDKAASTIFRYVGDDSSWKAHEATSLELFLAYRRSLGN